jgi:hypothetical protein
MIGISATLSLDGWGDIAQFVIAIAALLALLGAVAQVKAVRSTARRARAYEYSDRFNRPETILMSARYTDYWEHNTYEDFAALTRENRSKWLVLPNLIEEVAAMYNRNLVDRDITAEVLGPLAEAMWRRSIPLVVGSRKSRKDRWVYAEWEQMQKDTLRRRSDARRRRQRGPALRRLLSASSRRDYARAQSEPLGGIQPDAEPRRN